MRLSPQQLRCVALVAAGDSNDEIAARLSITTRTVKAHLSYAYVKCGARNRVELATWYVREYEAAQRRAA
jgi:two-component system, NarL family, nitrate/nitrite response regulator NarL